MDRTSLRSSPPCCTLLTSRVIWCWGHNWNTHTEPRFHSVHVSAQFNAMYATSLVAFALCCTAATSTSNNGAQIPQQHSPPLSIRHTYLNHKAFIREVTFQPRTFKNPPKLPSPPPHKGSSCQEELVPDVPRLFKKNSPRCVGNCSIPGAILSFSARVPRPKKPPWRPEARAC
jgi:hypothetical protein